MQNKESLRDLIRGELGEKIVAIFLIMLLICGFLYVLNWSSPIDGNYIRREFPNYFAPAALTLLITAASYAVGMAIGFSLGLLRTARFRPVRFAATAWIEAIRGTPLFVQLLLLFAVFSYFNPGDLDLPRRLLVTGFLAMMINTGAYQAEIFRAGLQSVSAGQIEAARAVGLGYWGSMRSVVFPQAFRVVIPPLTNEFILMLKASALLSVINVRELTYYAKIQTFTGTLVEVYIMVTILYLAMTIPLAKVIGYLEQRYRIPGLGLQQETRTRQAMNPKSAMVRLAGFSVSGASGSTSRRERAFTWEKRGQDTEARVNTRSRFRPARPSLWSSSTTRRTR